MRSQEQLRNIELNNSNILRSCREDDFFKAVNTTDFRTEGDAIKVPEAPEYFTYRRRKQYGKCAQPPRIAVQVPR